MTELSGFFGKSYVENGFQWVNRIMSYISSMSYSFKIKGAVCGEVVPSRGLR